MSKNVWQDSGISVQGWESPKVTWPLSVGDCLCMISKFRTVTASGPDDPVFLLTERRLSNRVIRPRRTKEFCYDHKLRVSPGQVKGMVGPCLSPTRGPRVDEQTVSSPRESLVSPPQRKKSGGCMKGNETGNTTQSQNRRSEYLYHH